MKRAFIFALSMTLAFSAVSAQQPNDPALGSMTINGTAGPPYPITNVFVYGGTNAVMDIRGGANVAFLVAMTGALNPPPGFPAFGGFVDLDLSGTITPILDGFFSDPATYRCDGNGEFQALFPVPTSIAGNLTSAWQAVVQEPASPFGAVMTAASSILTAPGLLSQNFSLGDDNCVFVNTQSTYGFNIPFYSNSWNGCWICANGFINFGAQNTDFTPTNSKMHTQQPKISPFWSDLDPTVAGSGPISLVVDQISPSNPVMTFHFNHIPDWPVGVNGGLGYHTYGVVIDVASGDVTIQSFPNNQNSNYDIMIGISAGNGLDPTGPGSMDLSATFAQGPYTGLPNEGMYEGFRGVTSITGAFPAGQSYDLAGNYWKYTAVGAGSAGAFYIMDITNPPAGF